MKQSASSRKKKKLIKKAKAEEADVGDTYVTSYSWIYTFYLLLMIPLAILFIAIWIFR